ncbi:MAG: hypothetical protein GKC10_00160, partial [Methanosarcinales archaeon]|nr:hypothetical protein [Methanosarcinales archaeon]
ICNAVGGQESGIRVLSSDNLIRENLVFNNGYSGICVLSAGNNTFAENVVHGNGAGIVLSSADGNLISGNRLYDNREEGVRLVSSAGNVLAENNATRNGRAGIALSSSDENVLKGNWAWENGAGIFLEGSVGCLLSLNRLFDNREHDAYDTGINQWDDAGQGNLYADFSCVDSDGDGICDSGYRIPGGFSIDNLPLAGGSRSLPRSVQPGTRGALPFLPPYSPSVDLLPPSSGPSPAGTGAPVMVEVLPGSGPWPWTSPMPALEESIPSPGGEATSPSALNLIDHAMVRAIRPSGDPEGRTSTFSAGDPRAYSWVQFGPVYEAHDLLWRWYYPDSSLYGESRGRIPEPQSRGLEHWFSPKYWSELEIQGGLAGRHPGEWRVEFYVDGEMMVAERFSIV